MGLFVSGRRPRPRRFDYTPRVYDPSKDESLRRRMRVSRMSATKRSSPTKALLYGAMVVVALYIVNSIDGAGVVLASWFGG
jgi:hypothetical protein